MTLEHLAKYVGQHVTLTTERRGKRVAIDGTIDRVERVHGVTMTTDAGRFLGFRIRVKPDDGSRAVWSCTFADEAFPLQAHKETTDGG